MKLSRSLIVQLVCLSISVLLYIVFIFQNSHDHPASNFVLPAKHSLDEFRQQLQTITGFSHGPPDRTKIAYLFAGSVRSFTCAKVHWSIKSNLIDALGGDPHVFVRISTVDNSNAKRTGAGLYVEPTYRPNEINETLRLLNPRQVQYISLATEESEMAAVYPGERHQAFRVNDRRRYSMYFNRCMAYKMILDYEKTHGVRFEWVIMARLDAQWGQPVLPIKFYANDRAWLTESGWVPLNDQFMMVPRKYSDYLFDLDTKVQAGVYCLGGPDVEKWKCNSTALPEHGYSDKLTRVTLDACCGENERRDSEFGYSESINKRHFEYGKIPVSLGSFQVFLVRKRQDLPEDMSCFPECWRTSLMVNRAFVTSKHQLYPYLVTPTHWPDIHWASVSVRNHMACEVMNNVRFSWKPLPALEFHKYLQEESAKEGSSHPLEIDYSKKLVQQEPGVVHPSIFLDPKDLEAYRIHPIGERNGCLTWEYHSANQLMWADCIEHSRHLELFAMAHDNTQLFFMYVLRVLAPINPADVDYSSFDISEVYQQYLRKRITFFQNTKYNTTRVINYGREGNVKKRMQCLTVSELVENARVSMQDCSDDSHDPRQLFISVDPVGKGAHKEGTIGMLRMAYAPDFCVATGRRIPMNAKGKNEQIAVLVLSHCDRMDSYLRYHFEFEYIS